MVEGSGKRADLVPRPHGDLLLQLAGGDLLRLLGELLDGLRDAEREPVENGRTHDEKRHGNAAPEGCEAAHLRLDARERQPDGRSPDDLLARFFALGPDSGSEENLVGRLAAFGHDRGHELEESLAAALHLTGRRPIALRVSRRRPARPRLAAASQNPPGPTVNEARS